MGDNQANELLQKLEEKRQEQREKQKAAEEAIKQEESSKKTRKKEKKSVSKKTKIALISVISIVIIAFAFSTLFAVSYNQNNKIISGISINGIDVSEMTKEEAEEKLKEKFDSNLEKNNILVSGEYETEINMSEIDASFLYEDAVNLAYQYGREGNIFQNNFKILFLKTNPKDIELKMQYDDDLYTQIVDGINLELPETATEYIYCIEDDELIITPGKDGKAVDKEKLIAILENQIKSVKIEEEKIEIPLQEIKANEIDIEKIYKEIYAEAKDASIEKNPFKIVPHVDGVDFAISIDDAKSILNEEKEEYIIPLKITKPKVTTDELGDEAFPYKISTYSTKYVANANRTTNLRLAASKINNYVLMPGETFSYNKVVGKRTVEAGYKEAAVFVGNGVENGLGGGICQISSTLYNTIVIGNLDVVQRRNHTYLTSYVPAGRDATVVYGSQDFKFKNTRSYPVKFVASVSGGVATISMYGTKEDMDEYKINIVTEKIKDIEPTTERVNDETLAEGTEKIVQNGSAGCQVIAYKQVKLNGKVISTTKLSTDTYKAMKQIINVGVKKVEVKDTQTQEQQKPQNNENKPQIPEEEKQPENNNPPVDDNVQNPEIPDNSGNQENQGNQGENEGNGNEPNSGEGENSGNEEGGNNSSDSQQPANENTVNPS